MARDGEYAASVASVLKEKSFDGGILHAVAGVRLQSVLDRLSGFLVV